MIFLKLRQATAKDLETITMILNKTLSENTEDEDEHPQCSCISDTELSESLSDGSLYVFENGGTVIGGAVFFINSNEIHIENIFVLPEYCGQGFGTRIMLAIENYESSVKKLTIDVPLTNEIMMHLCKNCGYTDICRVDDYICFEKIPSEDTPANMLDDKKRKLSSYEGKNVRISLRSGEVYEGKCSYLSSSFIYDVFDVDEEGLRIDENVFFISDINKVEKI